MTRVFRTAPLIILLTACASASDGAPSAQRSTSVISSGTSTGSITTNASDVGSRFHISAPADLVWTAVQLAYADMFIEAGVLDPADRIYGTRRLVTSRIAGDRASRLVNCGTGPFGAPAADSYEVTFSIATSVAEAVDGTNVVTWMTATAQPRGTSGSAVQCTSRGRLEGRINDLIAERLTAGA